MSDPVTYGVHLYGKRIGSLYCRDNTSSFVFDPEYLEDESRDVLGLGFEQDLGARFTSNVRLPVWFSNLLPEGVLRDWVAEERGVSQTREPELLAQVGGDLPGAVEVRPSDFLADIPLTRSVHAASPVQGDEIGWKFSLAGVGLKFSMLKETDRFTCPASGAGGDWIVKLPDKIYRGVPLNEYAMMHLAGRVGIDVPEIKLVHRDQVTGLPESVWPKSEHFAFAVRRFDRGESREKIHIEDLAQVRGFYPEDKYRGNLETVANLFFRGVDTRALIQFTRRLTLNILIGNGDAHLKNWSLIYRDRRKPTISPAYDIVSTGLYVPRGDKHDLGLTFGGSRRFEDMRLTTFGKLARRLNADVDLADIADDTVSKAIAEWPGTAALLEVAPDVRTEAENSLEQRSRTLRRGTAAH